MNTRSKTGTTPQQIRIIGGTARRSRLQVSDFPGLRPTPERLRETLFNWLAPTIAGARCLDLFAGTGALGLEALSRGAAQVCFVERSRQLLDAIQANAERLHLAEAEYHCGCALRYLQAKPAVAFNLVFIDPPFAEALWAPVIDALADSRHLQPGARIYIEFPGDQVPQTPAHWTLLRESRAGNSSARLYQLAGDQD